MGLQLTILQLFLTVVLLPSLLAFIITFDNGDSAEYKLLKVENEEPLYGIQAFVLFAEVLQSPPGYVFQKGNKVALKICFPGNEKQLHHEQRAHNFIREKDPTGSIDGVVTAEKSLGKSSDLNKDKHFALPEGKEKQDKYLILIMERMGMDLLEYYNTYEMPHDQQELVYNQLISISEQFAGIGFVHGDIKPANVLFEITLNGKIKLADLGLSVFEGSGMVDCAGDPIYVSPVQLLLDRPATSNDCDVSGAYIFVYLALQTLPWIGHVKDMQLAVEREDYDLNFKRMVVAKHEFNLNPFATFQEKFPKTLQQKISDNIKRATKDEIDSIREKIDAYKVAIANSTKNEEMSDPVDLPLKELKLN